MDNRIYLRIPKDSQRDSLILSAKYLLGRADVPLEHIAEVLAKAHGNVQRRISLEHDERMHDDEASSSLSSPALDILWGHVEAFGAAWPAVIEGIILDIAEPAESLEKAISWRWLMPLSDGIWATLQSVLDRAAMRAVHWLTGRGPAHEQQAPWLPQNAADSYGRASSLGLAVTHDIPLSAGERFAIVHAQRHAGARLRPLFSAFNGKLLSALLDADRDAARTSTPIALASRSGPQALATAMGHANENWERDWQRVARTELVEAHNQGALQALITRHPDSQQAIARAMPPQTPSILVYKIPSVNACPYCKKIWLDADGSPRLYPLSDVMANGSNEGRKATDWRPVVGPIHPNCTEGALLEYSPTIESVFERMRTPL